MNPRSKTLRRGIGLAIVAAIAMAGIVPSAHACSATAVYMGTICAFPFNFCPHGWAPAQGQLLPINQNQALFSLFMTTYGGDGQTTFALPDLRGRIMRGTGAGAGTTLALGEKAGAESATLTTGSMPAHGHALRATNAVGDAPGPNGKLLSRIFPDNGSVKPYDAAQAATPSVALAPTSIGATGGGQPFPLDPPMLGTTICVATQGVFPPQ